MLIVVKVLIFFNKKALQGQGRIQAENIRAQMLWAPKKKCSHAVVLQNFVKQTLSFLVYCSKEHPTQLKRRS